jgi:hypothetical protein
MDNKKLQERTDVDPGLLYQAIINLQIDIAKLQEDVKWIKRIIYAIISGIFAILARLLVP